MTFCRRLFDQLPDRQSRSNPERWQGYLMIMKRAEVGFVSYSSKNSIFCFLAFILFLHPNLKIGGSIMELGQVSFRT